MSASFQSEVDRLGRRLVDCICQGSLEQAEALLRLQFGRTECDGRFAMHYAAASGRPEMVRLLVKYGANTEVVAADGSWPIHDAARKGGAEVLRALIEVGASLQAKDRNLLLPVHYAARTGSLEMLQLIEAHGGLQHGAALGGGTPLSLAVLGKHYDAARFLAERGGNVDETLLYVADMRDAHLEQVNFLLNELGADPECQTSEGWRPALMASLNGRGTLLEVLLRHPKTSRDTLNLSLACLHRHDLRDLGCIPLNFGADDRIPEIMDRLPPDVLWSGVETLRRSLNAELMAGNLESAMPSEEVIPVATTLSKGLML